MASSDVPLSPLNTTQPFVAQLASALLLAASALLPAGCSAPLAATASWDHTRHDFGSTPPGARLTHAFRVRNLSDREPIYIEEVRPSCGCITSAVAGQVVQPGESLPLTLEWDTKGIAPQASVEKDAVVRYRQAGRAAIQRLAIAARLEPLVSVEPAVLELTSGSPTEPWQGSLRIQRGSLSRQDFKSVAIHCPDFCHTEGARDEDCADFEFSASFESLGGPLPEVAITFEGVGEVHTVSVPVRTKPQGNARLVPPSLFLGTAVEHAPGGSRLASVQLPTGRTLRIVRVQEIDNPMHIALSWRPRSEEGDGIEFELSQPPPAGEVGCVRFAVHYELPGESSGSPVEPRRGVCLLPVYVVGDQQAPAPR